MVLAALALLGLLPTAAGACTSSTTAADIVRGVDLTGQVHLYTGADSGIGFAAALAVASANGSLIIASYDPRGRGSAAAENITRITGNSRVSVVGLDLSSLASVHNAAATVLESVPKLDVLMCDAGIERSPASLSPKTADGWDRVFEVNFLGHLAFVEQLWPLLEKSGTRIINVASQASFEACNWANLAGNCTELGLLANELQDSPIGNNSDGVFASNYALTKYLQVFQSAELAVRNSKSGITAFSLHPGLVATPMTAILSPETLLKWCSNGKGGERRPCPLSPEQGAATPVYVATAPVSTLQTGEYYDLCTPARSVRSIMVTSVGEAATAAYQAQLYDLMANLTTATLADARG